eukprot:gene91-biopygen18041
MADVVNIVVLKVCGVGHHAHLGYGYMKMVGCGIIEVMVMVTMMVMMVMVTAVVSHTRIVPPLRWQAVWKSESVGIGVWDEGKCPLQTLRRTPGCHKSRAYSDRTVFSSGRNNMF